MTHDELMQLVIDFNYHRQTAVDELVRRGWAYRDASNAVGEIFEELSWV